MNPRRLARFVTLSSRSSPSLFGILLGVEFIDQAYRFTPRSPAAGSLDSRVSDHWSEGHAPVGDRYEVSDLVE